MWEALRDTVKDAAEECASLRQQLGNKPCINEEFFSLHEERKLYRHG